MLLSLLAIIFDGWALDEQMSGPNLVEPKQRQDVNMNMIFW